LNNKLETLPIGCDVMIKFLGEAKTEAGQEYKDYQVFVKK